MDGKTIIKIEGNKVLINWRTKKFLNDYKSSTLSDIQINCLKNYAKNKDLAYLGDFLNAPNNKSKFDCLVIAQLMWAFSNRKDISVVIDNSYEEKISEKGSRDFNKLLRKQRKALGNFGINYQKATNQNQITKQGLTNQKKNQRD